MLEGWVDLRIIGARRTLHSQGWRRIRGTRRAVHWHRWIAGGDHVRWRDGWIRWEAFRGYGISWPEWGVGPRRPLVASQGGDTGVDFEPFTGAYLLKVTWVESRDMALEQCHALGELTLDALGVTTRREGLTMTVLLLASSPGGRTSGASRILRIALWVVGRVMLASGDGNLRSGDTDGTCLDFLASTTSTCFMRTAQTTRFCWTSIFSIVCLPPFST